MNPQANDTPDTGAPTRTAVLLIHAESYRQRSGIGHEAWCEAVDAAYCEMVPEHLRSLAAPNLQAITDAETFVRRRRNWDQQIRRIASGDMRFPTDLEEAWVSAMGDPWLSRCRQELARRHGLWGAIRHPQGGCGDHACWGSALTEMGALTERMGQVLADGWINEDDRAGLPDIIERARAMQSALASLEQRARAVLGQGSDDASANVAPITRGGSHG